MSSLYACWSTLGKICASAIPWAECELLKTASSIGLQLLLESKRLKKACFCGGLYGNKDSAWMWTTCSDSLLEFGRVLESGYQGGKVFIEIVGKLGGVEDYAVNNPRSAVYCVYPPS